MQVERRPYNGRYIRGMDRICELAQPKENKCIWLTNFGPNLVWGNQDPMWPISKSARSAEATPRLEHLAEPKRNFQTEEILNRPEFEYSCGRGSVVWHVSPYAMKGKSTHRIKQLSNYKKAPADFKDDRPEHTFSCGRESPIWNVTDTARKSAERERTGRLARAKTPHRDYQPAREVESKVTKSALASSATPRLETLSRPKSRPDGPFRGPMWPVSKSARHAAATSRQMELAKFKGVVDGYLPARTIQWPVTKGAKRAVPTPRMEELSRPIIRATMDHVQFNPDAFTVSEAAKKARCPPRVEELSQPIQR